MAPEDPSRTTVFSAFSKRCFPDDSVGKKSGCNAGDMGLIPGLGISPGEGHGNPLALKNPMGKVAWQAIVHGVIKSWI